MKILFLNLGYARGLGGGLSEHVLWGYRHVYCPPEIQRQSLHRLNQFIKEEDPDLCCFVEIDQGAFGTGTFNQLDFLKNASYTFSDIENKYAPNSVLRKLIFTSGKSNAFLSKKPYEFEKIYFSCGVKRLIYKIMASDDLTVFFAHFSLKRSVRARQLVEARDLMRQERGRVAILGDFNILSGLQEIVPLLDEGRFTLLNQEDPTFFFHTRKLVLDLCVCSCTANNASLKVMPQLYSDHAALILEI
jgi:endonuclease/exonuclease/phosphatase family metal-dependent hydrolase